MKPVAVEKLPAATRALAVGCPMPIWTSLPVLKADAVQPGKPIIFDTPRSVSVPGTRAVPFKSTPTLPVPAPAPAPTVAKDFDLQASIELPSPVEVGKDIEATYLIGNLGSKPVWVDQNAIVPANATWELAKGGTVVATIDGSALRGLLSLLPARTPVMLNPGEYLSYRRVLLASALPLKRGGTYELRMRLDASWSPAAPGGQDQPRSQPVAGSLTFKAEAPAP